jgi:hypothetical protein
VAHINNLAYFIICLWLLRRTTAEYIAYGARKKCLEMQQISTSLQMPGEVTAYTQPSNSRSNPTIRTDEIARSCALLGVKMASNCQSRNAYDLARQLGVDHIHSKEIRMCPRKVSDNWVTGRAVDRGVYGLGPYHMLAVSKSLKSLVGTVITTAGIRKTAVRDKVA